jgi:protein-tyrosine phosphatase
MKLSDLITIDKEVHLDADLCSNRHLWDGNGLKNHKLPINFRTINNGIVEFSASGIFTKSQIVNAFSNVNAKTIYVVDLLKEYHGFIDCSRDAIPFTWRALYNTVNFGVSYQNVEENEKQIIDKMRQKLANKAINIIAGFSSNEGAVEKIYQEVKINKYKSIVSEETLLKGEKINYLRLPCPDHTSPSYKSILDLAYFTQNTFDAQNDYIHFHCHGGKGRSTTFSVIFDMFIRLEHSVLNKISFETLLDFHRESGGKDLATHPTEGWKVELAEERYNILGQLYNLLNRIEKCGLKDIYSVALKIVFLNKHQTLDNISFSRIILDAGPIVQERIASDKAIEAALYDLYCNPDILNEGYYNYESSNVLDDCQGIDILDY